MPQELDGSDPAPHSQNDEELASSGFTLPTFAELTANTSRTMRAEERVSEYESSGPCGNDYPGVTKARKSSSRLPKNIASRLEAAYDEITRPSRDLPVRLPKDSSPPAANLGKQSANAMATNRQRLEKSIDQEEDGVASHNSANSSVSEALTKENLASLDGIDGSEATLPESSGDIPCFQLRTPATTTNHDDSPDNMVSRDQREADHHQGKEQEAAPLQESSVHQDPQLSKHPPSRHHTDRLRDMLSRHGRGDSASDPHAVENMQYYREEINEFLSPLMTNWDSIKNNDRGSWPRDP
ncbi:MAG: hypothetical protein M1820_009236 [Bogoriella megaspora]|nr:MAG: hypothetical protein M1820_009236 [Bogoriella megaspora]